MSDQGTKPVVSGSTYVAGKYAKAQCPVCGDAGKYMELRKRWDGQFVCRSCLDPRHPADRRRAFKDAVALHHGKPNNAKHDVNVGFGLFAMTHDWLGNFTVSIT